MPVCVAPEGTRRFGILCGRSISCLHVCSPSLVWCRFLARSAKLPFVTSAAGCNWAVDGNQQEFARSMNVKQVISPPDDRNFSGRGIRGEHSEINPCRRPIDRWAMRAAFSRGLPRSPCAYRYWRPLRLLRPDAICRWTPRPFFSSPGRRESFGTVYGCNSGDGRESRSRKHSEQLLPTAQSGDDGHSSWHCGRRLQFPPGREGRTASIQVEFWSLFFAVRLLDQFQGRADWQTPYRRHIHFSRRCV